MQGYKQIILRTIDKLGYELRRKKGKLEELSCFESCLLLLSGKQKKINILQVGANDGSINDPLFGFVSRNTDRVRIILVEPQEQILPYLEDNYAFQKEKCIFNGAIGSAQELTLYQIRKEFWGNLVVPYATGWPDYRAPTGVTSASYEHVSAWLSRHYFGKTPFTDVIEEVSVECLDVISLLKKAQLFETLDVLQVDAEGYDDEVIYASNIDKLRPSIINFELANLSAEKAEDLKKFLCEYGYTLSRHGIDGLAIQTGRTL